MQQKLITIYTDGSCLGNPGPGGYGGILMYDENMKTIEGGEEDTTNNRMELKAVIESLKCVKKNNIPIHIYTDSSYVKKGITQYIQKWQKNGWKLSNKEAVKNQDLWKQLLEYINKYKISWHWVKGHSDNHLNNLVDKIARKQAQFYKNK